MEIVTNAGFFVTKAGMQCTKNSLHHDNSVKQAFSTGIVDRTAIYVLLRQKDKAGNHRIVMDIVDFLINDMPAPQFNRMIVVSPKLIRIYIGCEFSPDPESLHQIFFSAFL